VHEAQADCSVKTFSESKYMGRVRRTKQQPFSAGNCAPRPSLLELKAHGRKQGPNRIARYSRPNSCESAVSIVLLIAG